MCNVTFGRDKKLIILQDPDHMSSERLMLVPLISVCLLFISFNVLFDAVIFKKVNDLHARNVSFDRLGKDFVVKKSSFQNGTLPATQDPTRYYITFQEEEEEIAHLKLLQEKFDQKKELLQKQRDQYTMVRRNNSMHATV
jgi:hypothetical protein